MPLTEKQWENLLEETKMLREMDETAEKQRQLEIKLVEHAALSYLGSLIENGDSPKFGAAAILEAFKAGFQCGKVTQ